MARSERDKMMPTGEGFINDIDGPSDEECRRAGLNILDALPTHLEEREMTEQYIEILLTLGFNEE